MRYLLTIPARNEENTIAGVINDFRRESEILGFNLSIQVIDDNSSDNTYLVARDLGVSVYTVESSSLADVFRHEMEFAKSFGADIIIHADADGQHSARDLAPLLTKISNGCDIVLGNRLHCRPPGMPDINYAANRLISEMVSILTGIQISDSQTGYRVMRRSVIESLKITSQFTYTQEQIIRAAHIGLHIGEVGIDVRQRAYGVSRLVKNPFYYLKNAFSEIELLAFELKLPLDGISGGRHSNNET